MSPSEVPTDPAAAPEGRSLAARFGRQLHLVGDAGVGEAVERALRFALQRRMLDLDPAVMAGVCSDTRKLFLQALRRKATRVRGLSQSEFLAAVERTRQRIRREQVQTEVELERVTRLLDERKQEMEAEQDRIREGLARDGEAADRAFEQELHELFGRHFAEGWPLDRLEKEVRSLTLAALDRERGRVLEVLRTQHAREVEQLERRIRKLLQSLDRLENELLRVAQMKEGDPGIASIYRVVQGLSPTDPRADLKQEMMARIFEANVELLEHLRKESLPKAG